MEIRVFNKSIEPLGAIDEIVSFLWHTKYFDAGTFSLLAPITENNRRLLTEGNILTKHDARGELQTADGGIWRKAAQITYIHITKDENGLEQIEAQGYMLSRWLSKRIIFPQMTMTGTNQDIINALVKNNCGETANKNRRFQQFSFLPQDEIEGAQVAYTNEEFAGLGQEVKARALAGKLGYDILMNERTRQYGFYLYKGKDFTAQNSEGNAPCIFSRDFDNVFEQEYTSSIENYGNYIYVYGEADEDENRPLVRVDGEHAEGLDLVEVFCDASDITRKNENGEIIISFYDYVEMLKTKGRTELENYGNNINFVSVINTDSNLRFGRDFKLGDRVTCKERYWGIQIDARITEITETYQKGKETIEATFGESLPTLLEQIKKVR